MTLSDWPSNDIQSLNDPWIDFVAEIDFSATEPTELDLVNIFEEDEWDSFLRDYRY